MSFAERQNLEEERYLAEQYAKMLAAYNAVKARQSSQEPSSQVLHPTQQA